MRRREEHVGFSGTRTGMTEAQLATVANLLSVLSTRETVPLTAHHGDCVGADTQFHHLCRSMGLRVEIHPPDNPTYRAYNDGFIYPEKPYLKRNLDIVLASYHMITTPGQMHEIRRGSGTWSTIRVADKQNCRLHVVLPNGKRVDASEVLTLAL